MVVLLLLVMMLGVHTGSVQAAQPAKGVFETCPACRLNAMPELKRFLMQSIMTKEYGENLSVKYIFGKTPTLILYDADGKVMSQTEVDARLDFAALHQWVQGMGFVKQAGGEGEGNSTTSGTAAADTATQQTPTAAAGGTPAAAAAAGNTAGTALLPATPQTATQGPAVATAAAATPAAPAPAQAAPVPAEPPALKPTQAGQKPPQQPEQQQQRRRHRRRRMRQRGQQGQQQHRRRRQEGPGNLYL